MGKERLSSVDCAKGIAMLFVIVGHTITNEIILQLIYSFHMPLFFIASGLTSKYSEKDKFKTKALMMIKKFISLAVILSVLMFVLKQLLGENPFELLTATFWKDLLLSLIWQKSDKVNFFGQNIPAVGLPWFLFAMVYGRCIYDGLHIISEKYCKWCYVGLFVLGVGLTFFIELPFSLNIVLQIPLFMYIGRIIKPIVKKQNILLTIIFVAIWGAMNIFLVIPHNPNSHLNMALYHIYPLCYIVAVIGTVAFLEIGNIVEWFEKKTHIKIISFIGKNSIWLFVIHGLDFLWIKPVTQVFPEMLSVTRTVLDVLIMFFAFYLWKIVKGKLLKVTKNN